MILLLISAPSRSPPKANYPDNNQMVFAHTKVRKYL